MLKKIIILTGMFFLCLSWVSCSSVKAYEKSYLNDYEMQLSNKRSEKTESNFLLFREGASGANGGKNGGGCGCN